MTSSLCPTCGTPNPPNSLFCEKCGTRLVASLAEEPETPEAVAPSALGPKGLSLPTKSPEVEPAAQSPDQPAEAARSAEEEVPDWMQVVQSAVAGTSELDIANVTAASAPTDQAEPEEVPEWLSGLGLTDQAAPPKKSQTDELLPEWAQRLRTMPETTQPAASEEEEVPEWLKTLGATGRLPSAESTPVEPIDETPAFLAKRGIAAEPPATEEEELPEWLKEPPSPYFSTAPSESPPPVEAPAQPAAEEMPDWLRDLHPAAAAEDALPDWLDDLGKEEPPASESMALSTGDSALDWLSQLGATAPELAPTGEGPASADEVPAWLTGAGEESPSAESSVTPDWMSSLRAAAPEVDEQPTEEMPDWLRGLEAQQPMQAAPPADEKPDWMSSFRDTAIEAEAQPEEQEGAPDWLIGAGLAAAGAAKDESQAPSEPQKPVTDWLAALRQAAPEVEAEHAADEEVPEWLRAAGPAESELSVEETLEEQREPAANLDVTEAQPEEEGVPDWLKGLGIAAAGAAAVDAFAEEPQPAEPTPQKPVTDWLSALRQAAPDMESEPVTSEEEASEWLREESGAAPGAIGGIQGYDQEVPDWLRESGLLAQPPSISANEETPAWLRETQTAAESFEAQPPTPPEEEGVPDWLKGLGVVAGAAAASALAQEQEPEESEPHKPATDWLTTLRRATPEVEAEQAAAEAEPEWLRDESGSAPHAIGESSAYEQEVPDWLRAESSAAVDATQPVAASESEEDEGVPDWLKGLGGAAAVAAVTSRSEESSDEGLPDWLREAEPASALSVETPQVEEIEPGETPDWLRELTPTAAVVAAEPGIESAEELEPPEEALEPEPEEESEVSKAAVAAAAGLAAAAVVGAARGSEQPVTAPAEMPEWLKEIRQEQQVAKTAIPVPSPEAESLAQAEIPTWLEALRPTEKAAVSAEAVAPSETEGPLAGIANALPPAPIMGAMLGLSAKLQYAISAEDQARAGVLKELLTQHAVAPVSVEQFVVKSSAVRRRTLRWLVAFLIITALFVPFGVNLNMSTGLPLMPTATNMVVPPAVSSAAYQISQMAQLDPGARVLVVFDYDAAQAGELNRVAQALLLSPALRNTQLQIASLNPQGSMLARTVLNNLPDLHYTDLGFAPGQVNGVQSLLAKAGDVKLIIEVAASPETVRWWAEQLKANRSTVPLVAGVSAGAEPLAVPYLQSGQVKGLVSGFPGAVAYLNATGMMNTYSQDQIDDYQIPLDAVALANYVMVGLIVVGLIAALLRGPGRRSV
jgi:hypothetical protein